VDTGQITDIGAEVRDSLPPVDTSIDPGQFASGGITPLEPPQDIDAATIGEYTPYTDVQGQVNPESTVEGRLSGLLSQNSDYIQRARTGATQTANRRGMLNSSMAAGAAEGAAIDRALPIAQQDAQAHLEQQFLNQGYSNDAAKSLAAQSVQRENLAAGLEQDTNQFNAAQTFEQQKINSAEANKNNFAILTADLQGQLAGIDNELAKNLEQLSREYGIIENLDSINGSIYQQMIQEIGTILANTDKPNEAQAKINALMLSAGVEFEFSSGQAVGGGSTGAGGLQTQPVPVAPPPSAPAPRPVRGGEGSDSSGGGVSGSDGPGGGDSGGPTGGGGSGKDGR
jgi:hypothetical protein